MVVVLMILNAIINTIQEFRVSWEAEQPSANNENLFDEYNVD